MVILRSASLVIVPHRYPAWEIRGGSNNTHSHRQQSDRDLYATLIGDFLDAIHKQSPNLDEERLANVIGHRNIYCIFLPTLDEEISESTDLKMSDVPGYLGVVRVDMYNPIQQAVFVRHLFDDRVVVGGKLYVYNDLEN